MRKIALITVLTALVLTTAANAAPKGKYFDSNGTMIYYEVTGEGAPVVLIHGFQATGALNWGMPGVTRLLAEDYQVITLDVRGHGKSDVPKDGAFGIAAVHDVIALMDHLNIETAHIAGYSMGGMITIKLLTMFPERVRSAVIGGMGWIQERNWNATRYGDGLAPPFDAILRGFGEYATTTEEMAAIKTPLTVIVGTQDEGQLKRVANWQKVTPDLPVIYVEDATHMRCVFNPKFKNSLKAFIDKQAISE